MTGFSSSDRCVSFVNLLKTSRSASSAKLFCVRIKAVRFGIEAASVGCMLLTRLRARRRVCRRGERGKLERVLMSLSVKSIASWSYSRNCQHSERAFSGALGVTDLCNAQVLNRGYFVACNFSKMISMELIPKCSICSFQLGTHL